MTTTTTTTVIYPPNSVPAGNIQPYTTVVYPTTYAPVVTANPFWPYWPYTPAHFAYPYQRMKNQILAAGVALLFGYCITYLLIFLVDTFGSLSKGRPDGGRRLRDFVSRHVYIFGIACMLSICPFPGLYGTFHAVFAWITLVIMVVTEIIHIIPFSDMNGVIRTGSLVVYHLSNFIWYIGIVSYFFKSREDIAAWIRK